VSVIPATEQFRAKVASAVAAGGSVPAITHVAWGTNSDPSSPDQTALGAEVHRQAVTGATADGVVLHITGTLSGADVPGHSLRELGIFDAEGGLAGRRVFAPMELDPGTEIDATLDLQF
jgi:phage-related tail fiber protein|tara:strand:+ start:2351 stop:2707 length:357 start_codon:yes stop_codon:yes gene_type:complete